MQLFKNILRIFSENPNCFNTFLSQISISVLQMYYNDHYVKRVQIRSYFWSIFGFFSRSGWPQAFLKWFSVTRRNLKYFHQSQNSQDIGYSGNIFTYVIRALHKYTLNFIRTVNTVFSQISAEPQINAPLW